MDFPAAHSMDTTWFACDREGNLAVFDSGETNAVPAELAPPSYREVSGVTQIERGTFEPHLPRLDQGPPLVHLAGLAHPGLRSEAILPWISSDIRCSTASAPGGRIKVLVFEQRPFVPRALRVPEVRVAPVGRWNSAAEGMGRPRAPSLWAVVNAAKGWNDPDWEKFVDASAPFCVAEVHTTGMGISSWARFGLYDYASWDYARTSQSEAYGRLFDPARPVRLRELPPEAQRALERLPRFDLLFRQTPYLQPLDHLPCEAHAYCYVGADGRTVRDMPGRSSVSVDPGEDPFSSRPSEWYMPASYEPWPEGR